MLMRLAFFISLKKETINFYLKGTTMNKDYQIISKNNSRELVKFLSKEGQLLQLMLELTFNFLAILAAWV